MSLHGSHQTLLSSKLPLTNNISLYTRKGASWRIHTATRYTYHYMHKIMVTISMVNDGYHISMHHFLYL